MTYSQVTLYSIVSAFLSNYTEKKRRKKQNKKQNKTKQKKKQQKIASTRNRTEDLSFNSPAFYHRTDA